MKWPKSSDGGRVLPAPGGTPERQSGDDLGFFAKVYIIVLALASLAFTVFNIAGTNTPSLPDISLGLVFLGFITGAVLFPLHVVANTKVTLDFSIAFAVLLLFEPGVAILIVGSGIALAHLIRHEPADQTIFNTAQSILQVSVGSLILGFVNWNFTSLTIDRPQLVAAIMLAAGMMFATNILAVGTIAGLQTGQSPLVIARQMIEVEGPALPLQFVLGLMTAVLIDAHLWALPFLFPLAFAVYRSIERLAKAHEQALILAEQAFHDPLTKLPNRALLFERLRQALDDTTQPQSSIAVLFLDLNRFKFINDSLGHEAGDHMLIAVSQRLKQCLRTEHTIARLGGDEFTILLQGIAHEDDATRVAERIHETLRQPFVIAGQEVFIRVSIGIAIGKSAMNSPEDLMRAADLAMYRAKRMGKPYQRASDLERSPEVCELVQLESDLRRALQRGELQMHYQPLVDLATGRIVGTEALIRWNHPQRGLLSPGAFIPLAEETGLILPIGRWVLRESCRQARIWQSEFPNSPPLSISVNLSVAQLQHSELTNEVKQILRETGLCPQSLNLEVTESVGMHETEADAAVLQGLKDLGVQIMIDDFGTGYSSLNYLKRLCANYLKLDKSFIDDLGRDKTAEAIVEGTITLAHALQTKVVAEGVERTDQSMILRSLGCDMGQGYYFARPDTTEVASQLLRSSRFEIVRAEDTPTPPLGEYGRDSAL